MRKNIIIILSIFILIIFALVIIFKQEEKEYSTNKITAISLANEIMETILQKKYSDIIEFPLEFQPPFNKFHAKIKVNEKKKSEFKKGIKFISVELSFPLSKISKDGKIILRSAKSE